jgi:hypothetical protein
LEAEWQREDGAWETNIHFTADRATVAQRCEEESGEEAKIRRNRLMHRRGGTDDE